MLDRVPIRLRLTAAFLAAMLVMIAVGGVVVRTTVARSIDRSINAGLRSRVDDLGSTVRANGADAASIPPRTLISEENSFAQVVASDGKLLASSERFAGEQVLSTAQVHTAVHHPTFYDMSDGMESDPIRVLASPERVNGAPVVVLVGVPLSARAQTLRDLTLLLWIGGAVGAVLAAFVGYLLAGKALRAVDGIRAAAAQIDETRLSDRLPVPLARDELQRLTLTLNELLERVERAFAHERQFIASASHELRTPIAIIKAELELALATSTTPPTIDDALDRIRALEKRIESAEAETDRLGQLATTLLHVPRSSREHPHRMPLNLENIDLIAVLDSVQHRFAERARRSGRAIHHDPALHDDVVVRIDALRIEQAVANLLENSLQHGAGDITLAIDQSDTQLRITINDDGPGVPFAKQEESVEATPGERSGLGLQLVREIMAAHEGALEFSETGMPRLALPKVSERAGL